MSYVEVVKKSLFFYYRYLPVEIQLHILKYVTKDPVSMFNSLYPTITNVTLPNISTQTKCQDTTYTIVSNPVYDDVRDMDIKHNTRTRKRKREDIVKVRKNCNKKRRKYTQGISDKTWNKLHTDNQLDMDTVISDVEEMMAYYYEEDDDDCGGKYCIGCGCCYGISYRLFD